MMLYLRKLILIEVHDSRYVGLANLFFFFWKYYRFHVKFGKKKCVLFLLVNLGMSINKKFWGTPLHSFLSKLLPPICSTIFGE